MVKSRERLQSAREALLSLGEPKLTALLDQAPAQPLRLLAEGGALRREPLLVRASARLEHRQRQGELAPQMGPATAGPSLAHQARPRGARADPRELDDVWARVLRGKRSGNERDRLALGPGGGERLDAEGGISGEQPVAPPVDEERRDGRNRVAVQNGDHTQLGAGRRGVPPPGECP